MHLLIDNYDSFSYNLYQLIGEIDPNIKVIRNDEMTVDEILAQHFASIIISPGPGTPKDAGVSEALIQRIAAKQAPAQTPTQAKTQAHAHAQTPTLTQTLSPTPILGVCLGHQAICESLGGSIVHAKKLMHGKQSLVSLDHACPLFKGLDAEELVARYHSLAACANDLPACLRVMAEADDGEIMAVMHKTLPIYGLQFHPESIMTPNGKQILKNFMHNTQKGADND